MDIRDITRLFSETLDKELKYESFQDKLALLDKLRESDWIQDYREKLLQEPVRCQHCKKLSPAIKFDIQTREVLLNDVFIDCSNDPDEPLIYGDAKFRITYSICPICKNQKELKSEVISISNMYYL